MNNQPSPAPRRVRHSASELAWRHFVIHWFAGMAIMAVVVTGAVLLDNAPKGSSSSGGLAFGIPAGVVGLLRVPLMISAVSAGQRLASHAAGPVATVAGRGCVGVFSADNGAAATKSKWGSRCCTPPPTPAARCTSISVHRCPGC